MNLRRAALCFGVSVCLSLAHGDASAYTNEYNCDGVETWHHQMQMYKDLCSVPAGSPQDQAYTGTWATWTFTNPHLSSIVDLGGHTYNDGCVINHGNGRSEFALVPADQIPGDLGLTIIYRSQVCVFSAGEFEETDTMIRGDMSFGNEDESYFNVDELQQGQAVMVHEFGHVIGLDHFEAFNLMRTGMYKPPGRRELLARGAIPG